MRKLMLSVAIAVLSIAGFTGSALAATGVSITGPTSTTATATNLTLTGSAVGTVVGNVTLNISNIRTGRISCSGTLVQLATISSGTVQILTPTGVTAALLFGTPWTVNGQCSGGNVVVDGSGQPILRILNVQFSIRLPSGLLFLYTGSQDGALNAAGSSIALTTSSLVASPGGSAGTLRGSFGVSPAISYTLF